MDFCPLPGRLFFRWIAEFVLFLSFLQSSLAPPLQSSLRVPSVVLDFPPGQAPKPQAPFSQRSVDEADFGNGKS
jgi:hypothetical protein